MIYGYGRVSTNGQAKDGNSLEVQERLIKEHGAEVIYMDSFTGTKMTRPEFDKLLEELNVRRHIVVGANCILFSVYRSTRLCRIGTYRRF